MLIKGGPVYSRFRTERFHVRTCEAYIVLLFQQFACGPSPAGRNREVRIIGFAVAVWVAWLSMPAQAAPKPSGRWEGTIDLARKQVRVVVDARRRRHGRRIRFRFVAKCPCPDAAEESGRRLGSGHLGRCAEDSRDLGRRRPAGRHHAPAQDQAGGGRRQADLPVTGVVQNGSQVQFEIRASGAVFKGELKGGELSGQWSQFNAGPVSLTLKRVR
jgi:hypothetical protein